MNRGPLQGGSPVQQMMAVNPNWWNINNMRPPPQQPSSIFTQLPSPYSSLPLSSWPENQELPESWSKLLLGGLVDEDDRCSFNHLQAKKMENWEEQVLFSSSNAHMGDVKQESSESGYSCRPRNEEFQEVMSPWGQILPASSPRSCITNFSTNMLDFSNSQLEGRHQQPDHSSECNSTENGSLFKKARVQSSSAQSTFKVRKEKLGDRITALHQLVSPFGKTDTASVLLEATGYIRFLQSQVEALSSPYLRNGSENNMRHPLLNDNCIKRRGVHEKDVDEAPKDLRSRGLCLVPVSCTMQVGSDNGADYWAPTLGGGFR
ncbi:transcription factor bHLH68-like isoform X2 [Tasmannia lanceolata]|uniref:transcription factor bHLH68-like isoform X2 n=1 Tax=Tasmannia lanceolata TaxID=3420 RepID=UPI004062E988